MMRRRSPRPRDDRGATIVLLGLVLVVLMIFAAFSVDVGTAYAQRRLNQATVDTAAVAGGVYFLTTGDYTKAIVDVKDRVADEMGTRISDQDWDDCTDPNALPTSSLSYSAAEGSPCISFGQDPDTDTLRMRVRLPDVASSTVFAGVIGIHELTTHAVAEVDIGSPLGGAFPAYVLTGVTPGEVVCIISAPGGQVTPCNEPVSGQFGTFEPYYYAPVANCAEGNQGPGNYYSQAPAIANGLDHLLARFIGDPLSVGLGNERINGGNGCTVLGPNTVNDSTGNLGEQVISKGLILGDNGVGGPYAGRLDGGPYRDGGPHGDLNRAKILGKSIDNAPLWAFLADPQPPGSPLECQVAAAADPRRDVGATAALQVSMGLTLGGGAAMYASPEALIAGCLEKWSPSVGPIFDGDFTESRRAVSVPRYWETALGAASTNYHIRDFVPAFLSGEYQKANGNPAPETVALDPKVTHWAGDPIPESGPVYNAWNQGNNHKLSGVAAIYVPCGSLPEDICVPSGDPGNDGFGGDVHGVTVTR